MSETRLAVHVLTGFLGSGKTTLLSQLIRSPEFSNTAVIINELGEVGLDHMLVSAGAEQNTVLLDSGCLCCSLDGSLHETLEDLYYKRLRGELPPYERVVIETTGLAEPGPIVNSLSIDRVIAGHYRFASVIATVDALNGAEQIDTFAEAAAQVAFADTIAITKTDLASAAQLQELERVLGTVNRHADVLHTSRGQCDARRLLEPLQRIPGGGPIYRRSVGRSNVISHRPPPRDHIRLHGISSVVGDALAKDTASVTWENYARWTVHLQRRFGSRLLRVKGILPFEDGNHYAIHGVQHMFNPPVVFESDVAQAVLGKIIFIAQHVARDELLASMALLRGAPDTDE